MSGLSRLIVIASQQSCWFGGQPGTLNFKWADAAPSAAMDIAWQVFTHDTLVAYGLQPLEKFQLTFTLPTVRVETVFRVVCELTQRGSRKTLARVETNVRCYPSNLLDGMAQMLARHRIVVWDSAGQLSRVLKQAGIDHRRIDAESQLQIGRVDLILVAPDQIRKGPFAQRELLRQIEAGAHAVVFRQSLTDQIGGYSLESYLPETPPICESNHPLLSELPLDAIGAMLLNRQPIQTIELFNPDLAICCWPEPLADENAGPVYVLLASMSRGEGELVLSQFPLDDWEHDPRAQLLLRNVLRYLSPGEKDRPQPGSFMPRILEPMSASSAPALVPASGESR